MIVEHLLVGGAVLLGAATQRITGMGFALMASPWLVVVLGASDGVGTSQVLTLVASAIVLVRLWRSVEWDIAVLLIASSLLGIAPGVWITGALSAPTRSVLIGGLVIVALVAVSMDERARVFRGTTGGASAGVLSGFMNVTAGVGGPPIVLYRLSRDWAQQPYVATVQAYFIALNVASLAARSRPQLPLSIWSVAVVALASGLVLGDRLADHVSEARARTSMVLVALAGAVGILADGIASM